MYITSDLLLKYTLPAVHCIRDYVVTGKICPNPYVYNTGTYTWDAFKKAISGQNGDILPATSKTWYRVRKTWKNASSQIGAFQTLKKAKQCADQHAGYHVYNDAGKKVYTSSKLPYKVQPKSSNVQIRTGPAKTYSNVKKLQPGTYVITAEKNGFGKLKSGAGWVYLKKVERV